MVASVSARKSIASAKAYYTHLHENDYYIQQETEGYWYGMAAEFLGLHGGISQDAFSHALHGRDPNTGEPLIKVHKRSSQRQPGWDVCLSAPKGVSVLMGLAPNMKGRRAIVNAHRKAVKMVCKHIEEQYAYCRRGKGGKLKEKTAGMLFSVFDHFTSRTLCPQLHSHVYVHNLAPRGDASWGTILSRPIYNAQKEIGKFYRKQLHQELQRLHVPSKLEEETIHIDAITRNHEIAFSVRRQQILKAMDEYGYTKNAAGYQKATLRTRTKKRLVPFDELIPIWQDRALKHGLNPKTFDHIWAKISIDEVEPTRSKALILSFLTVKKLAKAARTLVGNAVPSIRFQHLESCKKSAGVLYRIANGWFKRLERQISNVPTRTKS